jgi:hypothetical protein
MIGTSSRRRRSKAKEIINIAVGDPGRTAEDQRLKGGGVLPGSSASEVDRIAGELEFRIDRDRGNRQTIELRQQRLALVNFLDKPDLFTQTCRIRSDWQGPGLGLAKTLDRFGKLRQQRDRGHGRDPLQQSAEPSVSARQ